MKENKTCYVCDKIATTREHVPPLCLFPEGKDIIGLDFRQNLITVPSCDEHNSKKSKDDEFLMVSIAGIFGNNPLGYFHAETKVNRALRRKSKDFLNKVILKNYKSGEIELSFGKKQPIIYGNPDLNRLICCFKNIGYGLYYHEFHHSFKGEIEVLPGFLKCDDNTNTLVKLINKKFEVDEKTTGVKGDNPSVFCYQFCEPDQFGLIGLQMVFYGGTVVYIAFRPEGAQKPFDLAIALMNSGIPTTINIKGAKFEFNK